MLLNICLVPPFLDLTFSTLDFLWGAYNVDVENEYDETVKSNLKKQTISNVVGTQKIVSRKEYDSVTNAVSKEYDELDHQTTYEYNVLGNVKKITDAMGAVSEYEYQNDAILQKMLLKNGNVTAMSAQYEYDNKNRIKKVVLENGCEYEFVYDDCGNISSIKLNGIAVYAYAYDDNGKLVSQEYSNGDKYIFEYENGLVERVLFKRAGESEAVVKYTYEYDALNRVNKVFAGGSDGILLVEYAYDENNRVINQSSADFEIEKTYDNNGSVATQINTVDDYGIYQSYESLRHSKYCNTNTLMNRFKTSSYVSDFSRNAKLTYCDKLLWPVTHDGEIQRNIIFNKQNGLKYVSVDGTHLLSYKPQKFESGVDECGNVEFWFRQNTAEEAVLFSCKGSGNSYIEVISDLGHIVINVIDEDGNTNSLSRIMDSALAGQWNFFAFDFYNTVGEGGSSSCKCRLTLNEDCWNFEMTDTRLFVDASGDLMYNIGHGYNTHLVSETFNGDIACLRIFPRECATPAQETDFYNFSKQLIQGTYVPEDDPIEDRSTTNLFALSQPEFSKYEIYPLQKNVLSLKGKKPELFGIKSFGRTDSYKEEMFDLDPQTKRYAYKANGSPLSYKFETRDSGTAIVRAKTIDTTSRKQIFDIKDTTIHYIGLYVGSNGHLFLDYESKAYDTGLAFSAGQWHTVGFSFEEETRISQFGETYSLRVVVPSIIITHYTHIRIMLDGNVYHRIFEHDSQATARTVMIGRTFDRVGTDAKYPFGGLMETLAISAEYIDATEFAAIASKLDCTTRLNCYDEFDMYQGSDVYKSGNNILSDRVTYKSLLKTENGRTFEQLSHTVASESISAGGTALTTRAYTTDKLGRVTGIADSLFGNHTYEYDARGFLVRDDDTVYEYDANGNVTKIGTTVLEYDNTVKDKLVKVGDKPVTYGSNPLVPTSYDGNTYTFEGRRLARIQKGGKTIDYTYNDQGLRTKKTVTENGTSSETQFFYDGTKLIAEISPEHRLDFLYDENDRLYGFVLDKTATYFYVRDTLENVLGIVDSTGNLVVQYAYNAWGKNLGITGTLATTIGAYNPIRYKGYHFDSDTGMYYCHTRYYVPDWCRWLCADDISFFEPGDLSKTDLFVYCGNNPVNRMDQFGCSWDSFWSSVGGWFKKNWKKVVIGAAFIIGGAIVSALTCGAGTTALVAFGSALLSSVVQVGASVAVGVVANGISNVAIGEDFFDGVGDAIADSFMWGGILSGGSQMLSGAFRFI